MKLKNMLTSLVAGACLLAFAGAASAATTYATGTGTPTVPQRDINIYGASAQFTFWKREAPNYLGSTGAGCTLGLSGTSADGNHFIQQADCSAVGGPSLVTFRVSSKASYDGPLAVDNNSTNPNRDNTCDAYGYGYRPMIDPSTCSGGACANPNPSTQTASCQPITIGASDVQIGDFQQVSRGNLKGPNTVTATTATTRDFKANPVSFTNSNPAGATADYCRPLAIPFAFFVNNSVVDSTSTPISNLSSAEARMIFSGLIKKWDDLEAVSMPQTNQYLHVCYRHAGSGTHASIDAFMRPMSMLTNAVTLGNSRVYFNDSTGDMVNCIAGVGSWTGAGAIGYMDADRDTRTKPNIHRLTLDGNDPVTANVDDYTWPFATIQNMYIAGAADALLQDICTYAGQPSTVTFNNAYWSATCNMKHIKNSNFSNFISNLPANGGTYHNANCN